MTVGSPWDDYTLIKDDYEMTIGWLLVMGLLYEMTIGQLLDAYEMTVV